MTHELEFRRTVIRRLFFAQIAMLILGIAAVIVFSNYTREAGTLIFAFILGGLGGSISLFRRLPSTGASEMESLSRDWISTLVPVLYGGLMAIVTYLLFMSGILTGDGGTGLFTSNLFPNFTRPQVPAGSTLTIPLVLQIRPSSVMDVGKLLVWSFVAGYSERFVTSVLGTLEQRGSGEKPEST
jgi:hypothetical protein